MSRAARRAPSWRGGPRLAAALWLLAAGAAAAQPASPPAATPSPAPYVDRVLDDGPQPLLQADPELRSRSPGGWPRGWRVEWGLALDRGLVDSSSQAVAVSGWIDTPNHGSLSIDASGGLASGGGIGGGTRTPWRLRLDQRQVPFEGGWLASHAAGAIYTQQAPLAYSAGRVFLPGAPMEGLSTQWSRGQGLQLNASAGRFGLFSGSTNTGFATSPGSVASAGAQLELLGPPRPGAQARLTGALQWMQASGVPDGGSAGGAPRDTRSLWAAAAGSLRTDPAAPVLPGGQLAQGEVRWQGNLLGSRASQPEPAADAAREPPSALGAWADAVWRSGRLVHGAGLFRFEPGLRWGAYVAASDLQGAYWRADWSSRQLTLTGNLEASRSVSGTGLSSSFASVAARWRLDLRTSVGALAAWRGGSGGGHAVQLTLDHNGAWGTTAARLEAAERAAERLLRLSADQQWRAGGLRTLATALSWERRSGPLGTQAVFGWGLLASHELPWRLSVDAGLRGSFGDARQISGSVGLAWPLAPGWSLALQGSVARGDDPQAPLLSSALTDATQQPQPRQETSRRLALQLRYDESAGTPVTPLGGMRGAGAGAIEGVVYLDGNGNRQRDAQEAGVPGAVILLDRRHAVRTDPQGRYSFPLVAAGAHVIEIIPDDIPLPWSPPQQGPQPVRVLVRDTATVDFALQRER